jgi:hypothetical protein
MGHFAAVVNEVNTLVDVVLFVLEVRLRVRARLRTWSHRMLEPDRMRHSLRACRRTDEDVQTEPYPNNSDEPLRVSRHI